MESNVTVNVEQGLYVIPSGNGYSCLGFDVCLERSRKYAAWLRGQGLRASAPAKSKRGTLAAYDRYRWMSGKVFEVYQKTGKRCDAELSQQLTGLEGRRVEVVDQYGETRRFIVGKSTGWIPVHLEIKTRRSMGGSAVCGAPFKSVRLVG